MSSAPPRRFEIRELDSNEWELFRSVRLAGLHDAPEALGSTYEKEAKGTEQDWRAFLAERIRFVAETESEVVGTISVQEGNFSGTAEVTSLWVDARYRHLGMGNGLVIAALDWAKTRGLMQVLLWVNEGASDAERLYERNGFSRTGDTRTERQNGERIAYEISRRP